MLQISLPYDATPEQVAKAVSTIGFFVGQDVMRRAGEVVGNEVPLAAHTRVTPPAPPPPPPPAPTETGASGDNGELPKPPAAVVTPVVTVQLDSAGLPWDERIHSGNRTQNQDGTWKKRKNIPDATYTAVVAELRGAYPAPSVVAASAPPPPPPPASNQMPDIPPALDRRAPAEAPPAPSGELTFASFMREVAGHMGSGKLTAAKLNEACAVAGLANAAELGRPENAVHVPTVAAFVRAAVQS